ncbi:MAG TPA: hypothetical protein VF188_04570 [Longimicrobiales bacterium]
MTQNDVTRSQGPSAAEPQGGASGAGPANGRTTLTLPSGATAVIRDAKGRDLEKASIVSQSGGGAISTAMGLIAQVTTINGRRITYEDVQEMPARDVTVLVSAVLGNDSSPASGI